MTKIGIVMKFGPDREQFELIKERMYKPLLFYVPKKLGREENICPEIERGDRLVDISSRCRVFRRLAVL